MKKVLLIIPLVLISLHFMYQSDGPNIWTQSLSSSGAIWGIAVAPSNQQIVYAASNTSGMWKSTNGGVNWVQMNTGLSNLILQCVAVSATNPNIVMCGSTNTGTNPGVYRSTDGGSSWNRVVTGITEASINIQTVVIDRVNPDIAYIGIFDGLTNSANGIYKTTNGGVLWTPITSGIGTIKNFLSIAINPLNPNVVYAGTSFDPLTSMGPSKIYKTVNGGTLWTDASTGLPTAPTEINPVRNLSISTSDTSRVLAGLFMNTTNGGAYLTSNSGGSWTRVHGNLPGIVGTLLRASVIKRGSTNVFLVGIDGGGVNARGVWITSNAGTTWSEFNNGAMVNTYSVRAIDFETAGGDTTIYAGVSLPVANVGVYEFTWVPVGINDPISNIPNEFSLSQNYPNPFNPVTVINFGIPKSSFVTLKVYDISGKELLTLVNEQKSAGIYEVSLDAPQLSSGVYFYKISAGDFTDSKKMILVK